MDKPTLHLMRVMLFAAVTLLGGTYFPLSRMVDPIKLSLLISFFLFYGVMGNLMHRLFGKGKTGMLLLLTLGFTALGLAGRFFLDQATAAAFTPENLIGFLVVVPGYTILAYKLIPRD